MLSVRGEFGYWVFEGDWQPAQRPSWNYRQEDGGGIILDMLCHWRYVLDNLFGEVKAVSCLGATHIPERVDEAGKPYTADADDAAYATFELEGGRDRADQLVLGDAGAARRSRDLPGRRHPRLGVAGLHKCWTQHRVNTPKPVWNPDVPQTIDFFETWDEVPDNQAYDNGFKVQWEMFLRHVVEDAPWPYGLVEGAKGVQLAELGLQSWQRAALARRAGAGDLTMAVMRLPTADRRIEAWTTGEPLAFARPEGAFNRVAYSAAHVVADPWRTATLGDAGDRLGRDDPLPALPLGPRARRRRGDGHRAARHGARLAGGAGADRARARGGEGRPGALIACGAGTDHLAPGPEVTVDDVIRAYEEQVETVEALGGRIILMASRALAAAARGTTCGSTDRDRSSAR